MPVPLSSIARRAAWIRSTASEKSKSGLDASPVESSIESPAIPVAVAAATLAPTASGLGGKAAFEVRVDRDLDAVGDRTKVGERRLERHVVVGRPSDQANPALVVASA